MNTLNLLAFTLLTAGWAATSCYVTRWIEQHNFSRGWFGHPLITSLTIAVICVAWSYYTAIEFAWQFGMNALLFYGVLTVMFLIAPVGFRPLIQLSRRFKIRSIADLMVFRFHSPTAGALTTLCLLGAALPMYVLQLQIVANSSALLAGETALGIVPTRHLSVLLFILLMGFFCLKFNNYHNENNKLFTLVIVQAIVLVIGLCIGGTFIVEHFFDDFTAINTWLKSHPQYHFAYHHGMDTTKSPSLLLVFCSMLVVIPQILQLVPSQRRPEDITQRMSRNPPMLLMLLALPVFPILWAGESIELKSPVAFHALALPLFAEHYAVASAVFLGGLAGAMLSTIFLTVPLGTMLTQHWVLPLRDLQRGNIHRQLTRLHRTWILLLLLLAWCSFLVFEKQLSQSEMAIMFFMGLLQLIPGCFSVAFWPSTHRIGFITGLSIGFSFWFIGTVPPLVLGINELSLPLLSTPLQLGIEHWPTITLWSLSLNFLATVLLSLLLPASHEERYSAELCTEDELSHPVRKILDVYEAQEFIPRLARGLGEDDAETEVLKALDELDMSLRDRRPYALRQLRNQLEINLSGLMGTAIAADLLNTHLPYQLPEEHNSSSDISFIEAQLNQYRHRLTGLAIELDNMRLFHRNTLEVLPLPVCSLGRDLEIMLWNSAMSTLTGIDAKQTTGSHLSDLAEPWSSLLAEFINDRSSHWHARELLIKEQRHWINLHKASISTPMATTEDSQVVLLEDITEIKRLEQELLHTERLASIGHLAAGVAHEIGNPVTGIACLAQNLEYEIDIQEAHLTAHQILQQTQRINKIVQSLVNFSHAGKNTSEDFTSVRLFDCANEAINLLSLNPKVSSIMFVNKISPQLCVHGNHQLLTQLFINLLSNACDASNADSSVTLSSQHVGNRCEVSISDHGHGIPKSVRDHLFEPFVTTKEPGQGTGLGLALAYSIAEQHHASISITSPIYPDGTGTRVYLGFDVKGN